MPRTILSIDQQLVGHGLGEDLGARPPQLLREKRDSFGDRGDVVAVVAEVGGGGFSGIAILSGER